MDWADTPTQAEFRGDVREAVQGGLPARYRDLAQRGVHQLLPFLLIQSDRFSGDADKVAAAEQWTQLLARRRWVAPHWPTEYGGGGLSTMEQFILSEELAPPAITVRIVFLPRERGSTREGTGGGGQAEWERRAGTETEARSGRHPPGDGGLVRVE